MTVSKRILIRRATWLKADRRGNPRERSALAELTASRAVPGRDESQRQICIVYLSPLNTDSGSGAHPEPGSQAPTR